MLECVCLNRGLRHRRCFLLLTRRLTLCATLSQLPQAQLACHLELLGRPDGPQHQPDPCIPVSTLSASITLPLSPLLPPLLLRLVFPCCFACDRHRCCCALPALLLPATNASTPHPHPSQAPLPQAQV